MPAYAITLRSSATTARCAAGASHIPRTLQHVARPDGASPGARCGVAGARGVNGSSSGAASTSTSTVTGTDRLTGSLTSRVATAGDWLSVARTSWVIHSWPCWRVLTNADEVWRSTQSSNSRSTLVSMVRVAAKALNAPPMASTASSPAMATVFMPTRVTRVYVEAIAGSGCTVSIR